MKKILVFVLGLVSPLFFAPAALAHCPLCVAGAGAGLSLSRLLGIDDSITGVWLAAFLGAVSFWTETALIKDKELKLILRPLIYIGIFVATIWSFYKFNLIVTHGEIFGLHKLTFGMIAGGILFYLVDVIDDLSIKKYGKVFFPYQRIIVSLGSMLLLSIGIYILINYYI
ncbi:MAG: hypothetical protein UX88_C0023G0015 [Candidatus Woesebacteria bacterium GW2011_GWC2_47_16]|uniref:Uncharacterized protein n=6 Tax=Candidatus Woeseibacteriota TaxID=1752722 RepID=A0A1F8D4U2_9BACT|nr:MAG: hypothetical protein UX03_C0013G0031 [Candidatus Woesebacteria bacterium GW2011_GWE1_45_18]KKU63738.1 MAG: hypothetical protein UX88_C0023G0015 [Candidatus Woesebacteria bacterium GW2011_GWC2_47_16]OGM78389.1 MAG: hypothetical protein A2197_01560 [Candidatus Woesebacteria bacterium RIFOXYA1_FULL_48_16]OGM83627.1 MAG: hypothetical protein A2376_00305 [Candidatus Woesebacteria bacterium RIFOXYB1_FULL_47_31]OGM86087.1 MAG: hypothetical protein A2435_02375 [Candidatus Woesebacteria bacteriu